MTGKVLTGNRLSDGVVVFLSDDLSWSESIDAAFVAIEAEDIERLETIAEEAARGTGVTDIYLFDAVRDDEAVRPSHIRERIRGLGPTIRIDLGKQATGHGGRFEAAL